MLVRCDCCGAENRPEPGQEMLACSYCGAALAIEPPRGPERLILAHARSDALAEATLRSFLIERERKRPVKISTAFSFMPFAMIEDAEGKTSVAPACASCSKLGGTPYPPAGDYRFFDGACPSGEKVLPVEKIDDGAVKVIHLPVYQIRYGAGNWEEKAAVIGESWQIIADRLPPEKPRAIHLRALFTAAGLFAAYFILGKLAPHALARFALVAAAAGGSYTIATIHERATRHE